MIAGQLTPTVSSVLKAKFFAKVVAFPRTAFQKACACSQGRNWLLKMFRSSIEMLFLEPK